MDPKTPSRPAAIGYLIVTVLLGLALAAGVILTLSPSWARSAAATPSPSPER